MAVTLVVQKAARASVHSTAKRRAIASRSAGTNATNAQGSVANEGRNASARRPATGNAAAIVNALYASPTAMSR